MTTETVYSDIPTPLPFEAFEAARQLYNIWASAGDTFPDHYPFHFLSEEDQRRWYFFRRSATVNFPEHYPPPQAHPDTEKFGGGYQGMASDYMYVAGEASGVAEQDKKNYEDWKAARIAAVTPKWWQFWRTPGDPGYLDLMAYYDYVWAEQEKRRIKRPKTSL